MQPNDPDLFLDAVFPGPPRPPTPEPTTSVFVRQGSHSSSDWMAINIRLVGSSPLWGNLLWNGARSLATYLDIHPELYRGKNVLELGAGGGLPGIVTAMNGAAKVVLTDYPEVNLIKNLEFNVIENVPPDAIGRVSVQGYIWGRNVDSLLDVLPPSTERPKGFDLILLSDFIFNHSEHHAILKSCLLTLACSSPPIGNDISTTPPIVLVFYSHHRPRLAHRDMEFFEKARETGWTCELIVTEKFPPMFVENGEEEMRSTVYGWRLTRIPLPRAATQ